MSEQEITPGGPKQVRHGPPRQPPFGWSQQSTLENIRRREAVYTALFGANAVVYDDALPGLLPHIDVYYHAAGPGGRPFGTLVTGGMSDLRMTLPPGAPPDLPARTELVFYLPAGVQPGPEHVGFLRTLGRFPYDYDTWLGPGHTIPNGDPPTPIFAGSALDTALLIPTLVHPDGSLPDHLVLDGDPVHFLWPVPLTAAERRFKSEHGTGALLDLFDRVGHPPAFDPGRASYVD